MAKGRQAGRERGHCILDMGERGLGRPRNLGQADLLGRDRGGASSFQRRKNKGLKLCHRGGGKTGRKDGGRTGLESDSVKDGIWRDLHASPPHSTPEKCDRWRESSVGMHVSASEIVFARPIVAVIGRECIILGRHAAAV